MSPRAAKHSLEKLIDENEVFKKKIDEIRAEKLKFEKAQALSEQAAPKTMAMSIQPLSFFLGLAALGYEYKVSKWMSLDTGLSFLGAGLITDTYLGYGNDKNFSIFGSFGTKFYFIGETLKNGIYLEPMLDFGYENILHTPKTAPAISERIREIGLVPAVVIGFNKIFPMGFLVDVGMGVGYHIPFSLSPTPADFQTWFVVPKFHASIGWAW